MLAETSGQPGVARLLSGYLERGGQLSHAYLFMGPPGVSKRRVAKAWAADILTASHPQTPHLIATGQHPDFLLLQREGAVIRIEEIRNMEKWLYRKPYWAERRVVLISEAQFLNRESGNALLKTLEEPPAYAIIILVADNNHALLPTIVSRCQPVRFGSLSIEYVKEVLTDSGAQTETAALAAAMAEGSLATAALLIQKDPEKLLAEAKRLLLELQHGQGQAVILQAEAMEKDADYRRAIYVALRYLLVDVIRGQETEIKIKPEDVRQVLVKMDEHRRLERVNASQLFLSLEMLWYLFDLLKSA